MASDSNNDLVKLIAVREALLGEAAAVLLAPADPSDTQHRIDSYPRMAGMLASSLAQLKIAEATMRRHEAAAASRHAELERHVVSERSLFELAPVPLLFTDLTGHIVAVNHAAAAMIGYERSLHERSPLSAFLSVDERAGFRERLARAVDSGKPNEWRARIMRRGDVPVVVTMNATPVRPSDGQPMMAWTLGVINTRMTAVPRTNADGPTRTPSMGERRYHLDVDAPIATAMKTRLQKTIERSLRKPTLTLATLRRTILVATTQLRDGGFDDDRIRQLFATLVDAVAKEHGLDGCSIVSGRSRSADLVERITGWMRDGAGAPDENLLGGDEPRVHGR